jgi:hypothetical protein
LFNVVRRRARVAVRDRDEDVGEELSGLRRYAVLDLPLGVFAGIDVDLLDRAAADL